MRQGKPCDPRSNLSAASGKGIWGALEGAGWGRGSGDTEADARMQMEPIAMWNTWVRTTAGTGGLRGRKIRIPISRSRT